MERPHIYGDETKCRSAVARYIGRAEELLAQAGGVRKRLEREKAARGSLVTFAIEDDWAKGVRQWFSSAGKGLGPYLQEQYEVLPTIAYGLPPDTGKPRHHVGLDNREPWLRKALDELRAPQDVLGVRRDVSKAALPPLDSRSFMLQVSLPRRSSTITRRTCDPLAPPGSSTTPSVP